jgi:16S rRNA (cytosine1402-N4)-methyltransferase
MPHETIDFLSVKKDHWYIDCNLGGGGHTELILKAGGKVIGIDLDPDALKEVAKNHQLHLEEKNGHLQAISENLIIYQSNFADIDQVVKVLNNNLTVQQFNNSTISGILFDLGVSTHQLDEGKRGFSFSQDAPLDMRLNNTFGASAKDLVNGLYEKELADIFEKYGEESFARPIAKKIVEYRKNKLIETTTELAKIVSSGKKFTGEKIHPATKVFQAIRIAVNDELHSLETALPKAFEILAPNGRLVVISFHSLEDRIVKNLFRDLEQDQLGTLLTPKPIETSEKEIISNPKSRSAKLRVIEKNIC